MKITRVETLLMQAGAPQVTSWTGAGRSALASSRNWLFVLVHTDDGLVGVGEGSGWPRVVTAAVEDLAHIVIGEDARQIEQLWQRMRLAVMGHGDAGVVAGGAIGAIDMALWDLRAKSLGVPVAALLGGPIRERVRYYAHANSAGAAKDALARGISTVKVGGVAGLVERVAAVREAVGPEPDICVDMHGPPWLAAADAVLVAKALEPHRILFLEEPVAPEDREGWRLVRRKVDLPLAAGERFAFKWRFEEMLRDGLVDVIQPDTGRVGGLSELRKIAALAEAACVQVAPHSGSLGPVAEFAALHLMASIPNALLMERLEPDWDGKERVLERPLHAEGGYLHLPTGPGLGATLVREEVLAHPSRRNTAIATGGFPANDVAGASYVALRTPRAELLPGTPGPERRKP